MLQRGFAYLYIEGEMESNVIDVAGTGSFRHNLFLMTSQLIIPRRANFQLKAPTVTSTY